MSENEHPRYFVHSLEKGLDVLMAFSKKGPDLTLSEIAQITGMAPPTASRFTRTLEDLGYLVRDQLTKGYRLSPKILRIGFSFIGNLDLRRRVSVQLLEITKQFNVDTACAILDQTEVTYIERFRSNSMLSLHLTVGSRLPAHTSAMGRAILAFMDPKEARAIVETSELSANTPFTITDKTLLLERLEAVRQAGVAINRQELAVGMAAVAAPVMAGSKVEGSIGASFPIQRLEEEGFLETIRDKIMETARKVAM